MTPNENAAIVRQFFEEVFGRGRENIVGQFIDTGMDWRMHPFGASLPNGQEGCRTLIRAYREALRGLTISVTRTVAQGNTVACEWNWSGIPNGAIPHVPRNGSLSHGTGIALYTLDAGGKIVAGSLHILPAPGTRNVSTEEQQLVSYQETAEFARH